MSIFSGFLRGRSRRQVNSRPSAVPAPQASGPVPLPGTIPQDLLPKARKRWFSFFVAPLLEAGRQYRITVLAMLVAIGQSLALYQLIPLRERIPYLAELDETDGKLKEVAGFKRLTTENIKQRQVDYFLKRWTRLLLTIDSQTATNLPQTAAWVRGAAVNELNEWLGKVDRPIERLSKDPNLTRQIVKIAATYGQGKTVFLHIELVDRNQGIAGKPYRKIIQFDYDVVPEQLADDNPIGLAIIHFTIGDE